MTTNKNIAGAFATLAAATGMATAAYAADMPEKQYYAKAPVVVPEVPYIINPFMNLAFSTELGATSGAGGSIDKGAYNFRSSQVGSINYFTGCFCGEDVQTDGFGVTSFSKSFAINNVATGAWRGALVGLGGGAFANVLGIDLLPNWKAPKEKIFVAALADGAIGCGGGAAGAYKQSVTSSMSNFDVNFYTGANGSSSHKVTANGTTVTQQNESVGLGCALGALNGIAQLATFEIGNYAFRPEVTYKNGAAMGGIRYQW